MKYIPAPLGDLLFTGISQDAYKRDVAGGFQAEGIYRLTDALTLRTPDDPAALSAKSTGRRATPVLRSFRSMPIIVRPPTNPSPSSMTAPSLTAHVFLDGLGIGLGFQASAAVRAVLAVAVLAPDRADGLNTVNLSLAGSRCPRTPRLWPTTDARAPIVGIAASRLIHVTSTVLAVIIATFSGFFPYIGVGELMPERHRRHPHALTEI